MVTTITDATYLEEVKKHSGPVLIDFYTPFCQPCRMMAPVLDLISAERGELKIVKIDASTEHETAKEYGIASVPTFVLMASGVQKAQTTGFKSKKEFEKWLDESLS